MEEPLNKNRILPVGTTKNGDKIFCTYKHNHSIIIRGFYDFNKETFIITKYKPIKNTNPEIIIKQFNEQLIENYDWNIKHIDEIITILKQTNDNNNINPQQTLLPKRRIHKNKKYSPNNKKRIRNKRIP